jgi:50S ribosomal subunit-associated GTPase HflX
MPEFELAELDYELPRESANVVNVERPRRQGISTGNGLIESETQDRREKPGGKPERVSTKEASVP